MTDFPTLIIILVGIFLVGLIPLAICTLYTACLKRRWCAKLCLWDLRENPGMTTSVELDELAVAMREQQQQQQQVPAGRPRSSVLVEVSQSHRNSHCSSQCEVSETASDPGLDHINRFLGRSLSDDARNVYEEESDAGVQHIRRALGLMSKADEDPGIAHVRRALGIVGDVRDTNVQTESELNVASLANIPGGSDRHSVAGDRPTSHGAFSGRERLPSDLAHDAVTSNVNNSVVAPPGDNSAAVNGVGGHVNTLDRLPSYEEALDILAKANEPEEPPPCYDDAVNNRVARSTIV